MSAYLECYMHVNHLPQVLAWDTILCNRLSRECTTSASDNRLLQSSGNLQAPEVLTGWLYYPDEDWELANKMLKKKKTTQGFLLLIWMPSLGFGKKYVDTCDA